MKNLVSSVLFLLMAVLMGCGPNEEELRRMAKEERNQVENGEI
jgi:hypothetical protein